MVHDVVMNVQNCNPYWRPSIWKDIAIYTTYGTGCDAYQGESQNGKDRKYCRYDDDYWVEILHYVPSATGQLPTTFSECNAAPNFTVPSTNETKAMYYWTTFDSWCIGAPKCLTSSATRADHHGLIGGRSYYTCEWTAPNDVNDASETCCVIRARCNITTDDYQAWESETIVGPRLDYPNNSYLTNLDPDEDLGWVKIWKTFV